MNLENFVEKKIQEAENRLGEIKNYIKEELEKIEQDYQSILKEVKQEMERRRNSSYETQE